MPNDLEYMIKMYLYPFSYMMEYRSFVTLMKKKQLRLYNNTSNPKFYCANIPGTIGALCCLFQFKFVLLRVF